MNKQKKMKYQTEDTEAGNVIDQFATLEEAQKAIEEYEIEDKKNKEYTENFYSVRDKETDKII